MTPWENFITRRRIDVNAFIVRNALTTRETFLTHLREHGVLPPPEETINALFPPPLEVKIEAAKATEKKEGPSAEGTATPRSDTRAGKRNSGATSGLLPVEDRGGEDPSAG